MSRIDIKALEAASAMRHQILARADRIVDRLLPVSGRSPHGFYQREAFADRAVATYWRKRLHLYLVARLEAKAKGTSPEIRLPRNAEHIFKPGNAMFDVAAFIAAQRQVA